MKELQIVLGAACVFVLIVNAGIAIHRAAGYDQDGSRVSCLAAILCLVVAGLNLWLGLR